MDIGINLRYFSVSTCSNVLIFGWCYSPAKLLRQMFTLSALDVLFSVIRITRRWLLRPILSRRACILLHVLTAPDDVTVVLLPWRWQRNVFTEGARSGFAYFLVSLASCTAGISIHPDIPRQTLMLSQHGCRQASFSLPLQGQFIPNLLSMWQVQLCYWFGQSVLMCSGMRNAYCLPPLGVRVY